MRRLLPLLALFVLAACSSGPQTAAPQTQDAQAETQPAPTPTPGLALEPEPTATGEFTATPAAEPSPLPSPSPSPAPLPTHTSTPAGPFHRVSFDHGAGEIEIRDLMAGPDGHLWVATDAGIMKYDDGDWTVLYDGPVERLLGHDRDGRVWAILEAGARVAAYDPSGAWSTYGPEQGWTALPSPDYLSPGFGDGFVTDPQGRVWWATGGDDLRRFDPRSQIWEVFSATDIGFEPPEEEGYQGHFLADVALSMNEKVWVGDCIGMGEVLQGQGVRWFDGESWHEIAYTRGECVLDIEIDEAGRMWAGGFDNLLQYDPASGSWWRLPLPPWERRQLVVDLALDAGGNPWVEIMRYGGASPFGEVARYHWQDGSWVEDYAGWSSDLALAADGLGWLCAEGTVYKLEGGQVEEIGLVDRMQCQIVVDGSNRAWVTDQASLWWLEP